jgi:hypothetical protein
MRQAIINENADLVAETRCPLVMIEWEDSAQPTPGWLLLSDFSPPAAVRCLSVG